MNNKPQFGQSKPGPSVSHQGMKSPIEAGSNQAPPDKPLSLGEHLNGVLNFVADSLFGSTGQDNGDNSNSSFAEALRKKQKESAESSPELKKQKHLARHKEFQMTEIYDLEKRKTQELISQIKKELELLVKDIKTVDTSVQTVVFQEEVNPGTYHVNFFTQLRNFLVLLRRRVKDGATWLSMFQGKKQKSHYMKMSQKYGSQYMFGQEGQGLTRQNG